jgi:imidazolonepropionase-like amidohydrolase
MIWLNSVICKGTNGDSRSVAGGVGLRNQKTRSLAGWRIRTQKKRYGYMKSPIPVLLLAMVACISQLAQAGETSQELCFKNVRVFDGEKTIETTNVILRDGKIAAIGDDTIPAADTVVIDGTNKTLLPGLIDCHTHTWFQSQLQQAVLFGVTTQLDMMSSPGSVAVFREQQEAGMANDRADMFSAGAAVTVANGHGTQFGIPVPTLAAGEETARFVRERILEGSDYIKIIYEDGSAYGFKLPTITPSIFAEAVKAAHDGSKLAVAHISTADGARIAFESHVDGLVHLFGTTLITPELVELAKSTSVFVVPTATVVSNSQGSNTTSLVSMDESIAPLLDKENLTNLARGFPSVKGKPGGHDILRENIRKLHEAGVPILAGTDAPNPGTVHGASMHHELRLLVEAGMSAAEVLAAATSIPAKHFRLRDRGRIVAGLKADVVLVEGDPTQDIRNASRIVNVWKNGFVVDRESRRNLVARQKDVASKPVTPADDDKWISKFESDKVASEFGAGWAPSTDSIMGGDSKAEIRIVEGGADGTKSALEIIGTTRKQQPAFSGVMFSPADAAMKPADLSSHRGISFFARGNGDPFQVMLFTQARGFQPSAKVFQADDEWKKYEFTFADFDDSKGNEILGLWFGTNAPGDFKFQIDEVKLIK